MYRYVNVIAYIHEYIHTYIAYIHTYIHTYMRTYVRTYVRTYICAYTYTFIYIYIHIYVFIYVVTVIIRMICFPSINFESIRISSLKPLWVLVWQADGPLLLEIPVLFCDSQFWNRLLQGLVLVLPGPCFR